jgi:hypothetical protein
MTRQAIVTLAIGTEYADRFEAHCRASWSAYAKRHGFDLVVITEPLDTSARAKGRSPAWQKCLVLGAREVAGYDRVVWIDSDICINPSAPSILDGVSPERIGAVDEHSFPSTEVRQAILETIVSVAPENGDADKAFWRAWRDPGSWHGYFGLPSGQSHIVQTGVLVLSPQHHSGLLEHVYEMYEDRGGKQFNYEMRPLSHEIQARTLQHWIDPRFNALVWWLFLEQNPGIQPEELRRFVQENYRRNHFLHFAGCAHLMPLVGASA